MHADKRLSQMAIFYVAILLFFSVGAISTAGLDWSTSLFWGNATGTDRTRTIFFLYSGSAGLVLLWNYLFFGANELTAAFIAAILVAVSLLVLTASLWKVHRSSALFLGPFLIWMAFALVFSYQVMMLN